ncbi:MAG: CheR family methyltransferase [Thermoanaerobaculia bacterium]
MAASLGLHFPEERWADLERGVVSAAHELGHPDAETCARWLLSTTLTRSHTEVLASHLTIGETYFFREKETLEVFEQQIVPELLRSRHDGERRLRIWSAGCCTGEEPYSIAMLLDGLIPDASAWNVTILATDINPQFLRKAAGGVYGEWSFRGTPAWMRERYFKQRKDGRFELDAKIRSRVRFFHLNLAGDVYPSLLNNTNAMDVIFCRNVLMYFTAERAKEVSGNLYRSLVEGGWLAVSPTETSNILFSSFSAVQFPGVVLYRKIAGAAPKPHKH